jgi:hypothetical protein
MRFSNVQQRDIVLIRKGWTEEVVAYNSLAVASPENLSA